MATGRYRPRKEFKFWLFHDITEDVRLMEFIAHCKSKRRFASVLKNGIRLMWSLGDGNTDVLFELFPWIEQQIKAAAPSSGDNGDLRKEIADLKIMIMQQGHISAPPANYPMLKSPAHAPVAAVKAAQAADASTIADNFLSCF